MAKLEMELTDEQYELLELRLNRSFDNQSTNSSYAVLSLCALSPFQWSYHN